MNLNNENNLNNNENNGENIKIIFDDIRIEVEYWMLAVICCVLGVNLFL